MIAGYKVVGPLPRMIEGDLPKFPEHAVNGQYRTCRTGGYEKRTHCFHVVRESDEAVVGFFALSRTIEDLGKRKNAYVAVDYAYVVPELRGVGMGNAILEEVYGLLRGWIDTCAKCVLKFQEFHVLSATEAVSGAGATLGVRLDRKLDEHCTLNKINFVSPLLGFL